MEPKRAPRPHIAVVDDSDDVGLLVRLLLSPDYAATAFSTGEELLARLAKLKPDLVILDVSLTGACGLEIAQRIRERAGFEDLPILFLTGLRREELGDALERHLTAFLRKPFDRKALLDAVESLIRDDAALPAFSS